MSYNGWTRRSFLGGLGMTAAIEIAAKGAPSARLTSNRPSTSEQIRQRAAAAQSRLAQPHNESNGDEARYASRIASFGKCLPHNELGEADPIAFAALVKAMKSGAAADFEAIPMGGGTRFKNPQAALAFDLQGPDSHALHLPKPPAFASAEIAAEMVELYWQALTRDVAYADYATSPLIAEAAAELSTMIDFRGPKTGGEVTRGTIFRGGLDGDGIGPYISQFLQHDVPFGAMTVPQRVRACTPGVDFMTDYKMWLHCQTGGPAGGNSFDREHVYIRNARDLAEYVHRDFTYQPYMNAALILTALQAPFDPSNPYNRSTTQFGDGTFGLPALLGVVAHITINATKTAWHHKWAIHRRLRPEEYGGRVHNMETGATRYPIHTQVLHSRAASRVFERHGTYLLPMAYPEGCPTHPAYPAGHAVLAGACVTVLKAFFDESWTIPNPVVASADGVSLRPWTGAPLTVGNELNKLATNIAMGRDAAGVHWRSDCLGGIALGEAVAINYLAETRALWNEPFEGFSLARFDGTTVKV